jgi:hypothetical protein
MSVAQVNPDNETANAQLNEIFSKDDSLPQFTGGGKDFSAILDKARAKSKGEQFTLSPGQTRFTETGEELASVAPKQETSKPLTTDQVTASELVKIIKKRDSGETLDEKEQQVLDVAFNVEGKDDKPLSQTQLVGSLGAKVADGTATDQEMKTFNRLTEKAGTNVTVNNLEELAPTVEGQLEALKTSQEMINAFVEDPGNQETLKKSDINVVTNSKGQLQVEVKPKNAPAAAQMKELSDLIGLRNSVTTIESLYDPSFVGIIEGSDVLNTLQETTGVGVDFKKTQFRRVTKDLADRLLRARSGAQINEQEFKRLMKILPTAGLHETAFLARLEDFKRELEDVISTKQSVVEQSGKRPISSVQDKVKKRLEPVVDEEQAKLDRIAELKAKAAQ